MDRKSLITCLIISLTTGIPSISQEFSKCRKDEITPAIPESHCLMQALQDAKVQSQYYLIPGAQHGPGLFKEEYYIMMTDFFKIKLNEK